VRPEGRDAGRIPSSFRDPAGFLFVRDGTLFRHVARTGAAGYDLLLASGLYERLAGEGLLVRHDEVPAPEGHEEAHRVLRPAEVPVVTYPYEWTFGQLQDAALLTLRVQRRALERGLWLKDASAFNVQLADGRPVLIDTLSFEAYPEGRPWVAYRQFCQHFLAPLALMSRVDLRLGRLLGAHLDGVPLDLASALLPLRTRLQPGLLLNLHLHAWSQARLSGRAPARRPVLPKRRLEALVEGLEATVAGLRPAQGKTAWSGYSGASSYSSRAYEEKQAIVGRFLEAVRPATVWDLGANTGAFSRLAADAGAFTVALDADPLAADLHYRSLKGRGERRVVPLVVDLSNPTPSLGWDGRERPSLFERSRADMALALALVHHLAIGHNVPLRALAAFLARIAPRVAVEFVPKQDPQVQGMLASRADVFPDYTLEGFEAAFRERFSFVESHGLPGSDRRLFLLRRLDG